MVRNSDWIACKLDLYVPRVRSVWIVSDVFYCQVCGFVDQIVSDLVYSRIRDFVDQVVSDFIVNGQIINFADQILTLVSL